MAARPIHCFICFDEKGPLLESRDISFCTCRFFVHEQCWEQCKRARAHQDQCPFCNKKLPKSEGWKRPFDLYAHAEQEGYRAAPEPPLRATAPVFVVSAPPIMYNSYQTPPPAFPPPLPPRSPPPAPAPAPVSASVSRGQQMDPRTRNIFLAFVAVVIFIFVIILIYITS